MTDVATTKVCGGCGETKPLEQFNRWAKSPDGRRGWCSPCEAARTRRYRLKHGPRRRRRDLAARRLKRFGLTAAEYDALLASQGGVCAICGRPEVAQNSQGTGTRALNIDHDHETGAVRGLLCNRCNAAIGMLYDDPAVIERAAAYLRRRR